MSSDAARRVVATGRLSDERALDVGDEIEIAGWAGIVRDVVPVAAGTEVRIVVQARRRDVQQ
jgi:hypothetical protein